MTRPIFLERLERSRKPAKIEGWPIVIGSVLAVLASTWISFEVVMAIVERFR